MKKRIYSILFALVAMLCATTANAVTITKSAGWYEAAYCEWTWEDGASYNVYYSTDGGSTWSAAIDAQLVRKYSGHGRADVVGLKAGSDYKLKVTSSVSGDATTEALTVQAHDRNGFAHYGRTAGIGAYNNDGTLKDNARVLYVTAASAKTVKCNVMGDKDAEYTGIQAILAAYEKGKETRPLDIRIIGTVKKADLDACGSSAEGLQVKGKSGDTDMNITLEGIGSDAAVHGFGFLLRSACSVEFKNFAIMYCMDDALSLDTDNKHCWIHNMDLFYGQPGSDADQKKGDGTVDIKGLSSFITVSYNHFYDNGKCSLGGMKSETTDCWMTYHHNWFDHSDSRHPRIRTAFYHVYNNYFDGNAKYATGVTMGGSAFCESNYYRNTKYPFLSSRQGTDAQGDGTFSGEDGGVIKAYDNKIINARQVLYYSDATSSAGEWDAVEATSRDENVTAKAHAGATAYNNDATAEAIKAVPASAIDAADDVAAICRGDKEGRIGAGRMEGGDFKWTFKYTTQDTNYAVIEALTNALQSYASTLVAYGDGTAAGNAGGTGVDDGDGKGITQSYGEDTPKPTYAGGSEEEQEEIKGFIVYNLTGQVGSTDASNLNDAGSSYTANKSFKLNKGTDYVIISPVDGQKFKGGDKVMLKGFCGSDSKKVGLYLNSSAEKGGSEVYTDAAKKNQVYTANGTLTADADKLYLFRYDGTGTTYQYLVIYRESETAISEVSTPATDAVKATKRMKNGKPVIVRNGTEYTVGGARMK